MTPTNIRSVLRQSIQSIGLQANAYDLHSFRIGRTSDMVKDEHSIKTVKQAGRWKSNAVYRYIKL